MSQSLERADHVVDPISGSGKLTMSKSAPKDVPKYKIDFSFENLSLHLSSSQYADMVLVLKDALTNRPWRPYRHQTPQSQPLKWFQYAAKTVLSRIVQKNRRWSPGHMARRRQNLQKYTLLYSKDVGQMQKFCYKHSI